MPINEPHTSRRNRAFWQEHTDQWKHSGLSKIGYCQQHNLKPASFYNWSKKLEDAGSDLQPGDGIPPTLLPVQIEHAAAYVRNAAQFVHVERAATQIALPVDLPDEQIQYWLQAIHALHV